MLNCKEVAELASKRLDNNLSGWQKLAMNLHLLICRNCRIYSRQLAFLQTVAKFMTDSATGPRLSAAARRRIMAKLQPTGKK